MEPRFVAILCGAAAIDLALALRLLFRPGALDVARGSVAALATAGVFAVKACVLVALGMSFFGLVSLAYLGLFVVVPILGAAVLVTRRGTTPVRWLAALAVALVPLGAWSSCVEPFRLELVNTEVAVADERDGRDAVRVGVLADLQTSAVGTYDRRAVELLLAQRPDVILVPGDLFQGSHERLDREVDALRGLIGELDAPGGVFFAEGNCDVSGRARRILAGTGVRFLENEVVRIRVGDRRLAIGGITLSSRTPEARRTIQELERPGDPGEVRVLVAHLPDVVLGLRPDSRIDLVVAGHTHGGQVQVPFVGPLVTLSRVPRRVAGGGLHEVDGARVYVSRGVGCEGGQALRMRFLCRPEVTILTLR